MSILRDLAIATDTIIEEHRIDQRTYDTGVLQFFGGAVPPPLSDTLDTLQRELAKVTDPTAWYLMLWANEANHTDNRDINFEVVQDAEPGQMRVVYSVQLIMSLIDSLAPTDFTFTKAMRQNPDGSTVADIFFQVKRNDSVVYLGDKSNDLP